MYGDDTIIQKILRHEYVRIKKKVKGIGNLEKCYTN